MLISKKLEREFQSKLIKDIKEKFPGCIVLKNDPQYIQGIPDLSIFYKDKWAMLEVKDSENAPHRPNQEDYIKKCKKMSYGNFVYPENKEQILYELEQAFRT